jgi:type I restriction enzyme S subunit
MSEWPTPTLAEAPLQIIDGDRGTNYPSQSDFGEHGHCLFLNAGNVTLNGFNFSSRAFISHDKDQLLRKGKLQRYDIVLTTRGTVGNAAFFDDSVPYHHLRINSGMVIFRPDPERVWPRYLYLFVRSHIFSSQVAALTTGSAQPQLPIRDIQKIRIPLPTIRGQQSIACVLGSLDDKIELNRRMNETLEAMARAIFKDWFVDFGPTCAKLEGRAPYLAPDTWSLFPDRLDGDGKPEGWCERPLLDVARLISGGTPKTDNPEYWDGGILWASAKDVSQCGELFLKSTERSISEHGLNESSTKIVPKLSTVVVARGATTGRYCMLGNDMAMNQTCYALASNNGHPVWLHLVFGTLVERLLNAAHGSVFDTITTTTLQSVSVPDPGKLLLNACEAVVRPFYDKALANSEECSTLASLRDLLLPKLMSGEIRVKDAEKMVGEAA